MGQVMFKTVLSYNLHKVMGRFWEHFISLLRSLGHREHTVYRQVGRLSSDSGSHPPSLAFVSTRAELSCW